MVRFSGSITVTGSSDPAPPSARRRLWRLDRCHHLASREDVALPEAEHRPVARRVRVHRHGERHLAHPKYVALLHGNVNRDPGPVRGVAKLRRTQPDVHHACVVVGRRGVQQLNFEHRRVEHPPRQVCFRSCVAKGRFELVLVKLGSAFEHHGLNANCRPRLHPQADVRRSCVRPSNEGVNLGVSVPQLDQTTAHRIDGSVEGSGGEQVTGMLACGGFEVRLQGRRRSSY
ncbi:MAG: hypothetical protein CVU63_21380, partial [Deltaproteobacteria bacterium HGW-Deltaproteobacteria-20]